ncbi:hypothetical protein [Clostridium lacusfryxellense]|uniref:hypothetical protein n=1 Tax=Clostridium lacusfryxellense TaxID=205328 RepID=UPI001C0D5ED7|nr:hypothetical protein [Clostridium lacusfryxellense]MBU3111231.1 hypothetical protein [Clostridium lacusfryxellense]
MKGEINIVQTSNSFMYLVKSKALGYEFAEDWIFFWTFFIPLALALNYISKDTTLIYKGFTYIIPIFAMTIIRRNILGSLKYLLANIFIVLCVFIISFTLIEKVIFLAPIIICSFISMKKRRIEVISFYKISNLVWSEILFVICYFIAMNFKLTFMMQLINLTSINVSITSILYVCISRMASFMEWEGEFIKSYSKRMKRVKLGCIAFIAGVIGFFIILADKVGLYALFDFLTSKILAYINAPRSDNLQPEKVNQQTNIDPPSLNNSLKDLGTTSDSNNLITTIMNILKFIIFVVIILVAIYLLFQLYISIKNFYKGLGIKKLYKKEEREFVVSLDDVITGIKKRAEGFKVKLEFPFNMSNSKKIRKLYHKLIKSYKIKGFSAYSFNTPFEIESKVKEVLKKNISEATVIYEKARYNDEECSKEEVDKMKSFMKY